MRKGHIRGIASLRNQQIHPARMAGRPKPQKARTARGQGLCGGSPALRTAIDQLLVFKRSAREAEYGEPLPILSAFIERELSRLAAVAPPPVRTIDTAPLDQLLRDTVLRIQGRA
jgi:hypothetical protein